MYMCTTGTKAIQKALNDLKSMFSKYVGRLRECEDGSPSVSKFALENQFSHPSHLMDSLEVQNVLACGDPDGVVYAQDSGDISDSGKMVNVPATTQTIPET
jgi:hypothetical protein